MNILTPYIALFAANSKCSVFTIGVKMNGENHPLVTHEPIKFEK